MVDQVIDAPLGEVRASSTASVGTSLTTTRQTVGMFLNTNWAGLTTRNYASSAVSVRFAPVPWLTVLRTQDNLVSVVDYSNNAQDALVTTDVTLSDQSTIAAGDALYVGSHMLFGGAYLDVDAANGTGSRSLTAKYWNSSAWVSLSVTDGTSSSTSLDQDGAVTWTMPAEGLWARARLNEIEKVSGFRADASPTREVSTFSKRLFWTRWEWNGALDSAVSLNSLNALSRSTAYGELLSGQTISGSIVTGFGGWGGFEAVTNTGTANLHVNCATVNGVFSSA